MSDAVEVRFWGTRGSLPAPGPTTAVYGGNTSCIQVVAGGNHLVFDAGTGIRELGNHLLKSGPPHVHLFFSHYHWDHIMGFPFFAPIYVPGSEVHLYGESKNGQSVLEILSGQMHPPYFPIKWNMVNADVEWTPVVPDTSIELDGGVLVKTCRINHPQHAICYRVEFGGRAVVYATDIEHGSDLDSVFVEFIRDADVVIMDCSFTEGEYPARRGWGHATWEAGVGFAEAANVETFVIFHHLPERTDAEVAAIEAEAQAVRPGTLAAREGMTITLPVR